MSANKALVISTEKKIFALLQLAVLAFATLSLTACDELQDRLVWSADGKNLAVITEGTLRVWSEEKGLSPVLLPKENGIASKEKDTDSLKGVRAVWWLPQSGEAIVESLEACDSWQKLLDVANDRQKQVILDSAQKLKGPLIAANGDSEKLSGQLPEWQKLPLACLSLGYLALHDGGELKNVPPKSFKTLLSMAEITVLRRYHLDGASVVPGDVLLQRLGAIGGVRLSSDGKYLLCMIDPSDSDESASVLDLDILATSSPTKCQTVAHLVGPSADWSADGKSVVYFQIFDKGPVHGDSVLGSLVKMDVRAADGSILTEADCKKSAAELADLRVDADDRLRCLANGAVLMSSGSTTLPARADEPDTDNLFLVKKDGPLNNILSGADRKMLGETVSFFDLNPSQTKAVIATKDGRVSILDLQSGTLQGLCLPEKVHYVKEAKIMPSWKSDDELLFVANEGKNGGKEEAILLLWSCSKGAAERFGSTWPVKLLDALQK